MKLGVLKEPEGETRVAIVPTSLKKLQKAGFEVVIEAGAGTWLQTILMPSTKQQAQPLVVVMMRWHVKPSLPFDSPELKG